MKKSLVFLSILVVSLSQIAMSNSAKIVEISGEVKVRRGVEEDWEPAKIGMLLELIDSILTLEGEAVLELPEGQESFHLGNHAMLDIADLKKITERELFLQLMSEKIDAIQPSQSPRKLETANASSIHGAKIEGAQARVSGSQEEWRRREVNAAKAMYAQNYHPNVVLKLHKVLKKYPDVDDCGETRFLLAKAFEALNRSGQAVDAYQQVIEETGEPQCQSPEAESRQEQATMAVKRLANAGH